MIRRHRMQNLVCCMMLIGLPGVDVMKTQGSVEYPGPAPGEAKALVQDGEIILGNNVLECKWIIADGHLRPIFITQERSFALPVKESECFQLLLADGQSLKASGLKIIREPQIDNLHQILMLSVLEIEMPASRST